MFRLLLAIFFLAALSPAQTVRPQFTGFEVATIKPMGDQDVKAGHYVRMQSTDRFEARNYTLNELVAAAYDLPRGAVSGGPKWADADPWEILAKTPGELRPTTDEQMAMLKKLLTDRFDLKFHREPKEFSLYELTVAKGGPKLAESTAPFDGPMNVISTVYPAEKGGVDHLTMPARNVTIQQFASVLQRAILDRPVVDKTGLTGRFDFDLTWKPDESEFNGNLGNGSADSDKPGMFAALQEQLGLRLEAKRGPIEALVIDGVSKPSAD